MRIDFSMVSIAMAIFGFSMVFLALSKTKMGLGTRIAIGLIGAWLIPTSLQLLGYVFHSIFTSPIVLLALAAAIGYFVYTLLNPKHPS